MTNTNKEIRKQRISFKINSFAAVFNTAFAATHYAFGFYWFSSFHLLGLVIAICSMFDRNNKIQSLKRQQLLDELLSDEK